MKLPVKDHRFDPDRCALIRWKSMYIDTEWDPTVPHSGDRAFWCQNTQKCIGPDGNLVDDYECNETRPCFKTL